MERQINNEQLLTEDHFALGESMKACAEAVRFEICLPAYHLNHGFIKNAEEAIAKILDFKQKLEQLYQVEQVDIGIEKNKDIRYNCVFTYGQRVFDSLEELYDFCQESTLGLFGPCEIYDFNVRIYVRFMA